MRVELLFYFDFAIQSVIFTHVSRPSTDAHRKHNDSEQG